MGCVPNYRACVVYPCATSYGRQFYGWWIYFSCMLIVRSEEWNQEWTSKSKIQKIDWSMEIRLPLAQDWNSIHVTDELVPTQHPLPRG